MKKPKAVVLGIVLALFATSCSQVVEHVPTPTTLPPTPPASSLARWITGVLDPIASVGSDGDLFLNTSTGHLFVKTNGSWSDVANISGPAGPAGTSGLAGANGATGATGATGPAGASWFVAILDPLSAEGKDGDFHLNTQSGDIFKRTGGSWSKIGSLAIQSWLNGNQAPISSDGKEGDYYLNTLTAAIFQKQNGKWSLLAQFTPFSQNDIEKIALDAWVTPVTQISNTIYFLGLRDNATSQLILVGTGVAYDSHTIVTNAHVYIGVLSQYIYYKQLGYNVDPVAVLNGQLSTSSSASVLDLGGYNKSYDSSTVFTYDIGYFTLPGVLPSAIVTRTDFSGLQVGQGIGTMGFPGETASRISQRPNATFKAGVLSAVSPIDPSLVATPSNAFIIQHNFNTTGGTSGSPIFDNGAQMIALNNSGAVKWIWDDSIGNFVAIPTGSIGYGIRADQIRSMFDSQNTFQYSLSIVYIPPRLLFVAGQNLQTPNGSQNITFNLNNSSTQSIANSMFGKSGPDYTYTSGNIEYWDQRSYDVKFSFTSGTLTLISVWGYNNSYYLSAIRDGSGISIGSSLSYIMQNYGYAYTTTISADGTWKFYNYPSQGISFGFSLSDSDWYVDGIYLYQPNYYTGIRSVIANSSPVLEPKAVSESVHDYSFVIEKRMK